MNLKVETWGYEQTDLNELRYAAIETMEYNCVHQGIMCVNCSAHGRCECTHIHDAVSKTGVDAQTWYRMREWATTYYRHHPRS